MFIIGMVLFLLSIRTRTYIINLNVRGEEKDRETKWKCVNEWARVIHRARWRVRTNFRLCLFRSGQFIFHYYYFISFISFKYNVCLLKCTQHNALADSTPHFLVRMPPRMRCVWSSKIFRFYAIFLAVKFGRMGKSIELVVVAQSNRVELSRVWTVLFFPIILFLVLGFILTAHHRRHTNICVNAIERYGLHLQWTAAGKKCNVSASIRNNNWSGREWMSLPARH